VRHRGNRLREDTAVGLRLFRDAAVLEHVATCRREADTDGQNGAFLFLDLPAALLVSICIRGGSHRGYVRIFNIGDDPGFNWDKGGRLYSLGETSYQRLNREQRARITIDGDSVIELDIRASYLTILFAICGRCAELPPDPYDVPELSRAVVKKWVVATLGSDGHIKRWPSEHQGPF
jgi:hypothetical protein